jgi:hypothetical protein
MSGDGLTYVNQDIEFAGILLPRANNANYTNIGDLYMNGARTALYYMCMSSSSDCSKIYLASDAEEYWGTDSDVENYFLSKYGTNEEYNKENPMVKSWNMPTTVATLHPNIHFSQLGHNEIGKTAAENIVYALNYAQRPDDYEVSISVVGMDGYNSMDSVLNMSTGETCRAVVRVEPAYLLKEVKVINTEGCVYNFGVLKCTLESGTGSVTFAVGNVSKKLNISYSAAAPVVSCESLLEGMQITWNKIDDAKCYYVYRRPISSTKWELMDVVSGTSCMDYNVYRYGLYLYTVKAEKMTGL